MKIVETCKNTRFLQISLEPLLGNNLIGSNHSLFWDVSAEKLMLTAGFYRPSAGPCQFLRALAVPCKLNTML